MPLVNEVEFNVYSVVCEITKIAVKAYLEFTRAKTFGKNGYQQMQVDVYFLQVALQSFKPPDSIVVSVAAILANAGERCLELVPLEHSVMISMCQPKLDKLQQQPSPNVQ